MEILGSHIPASGAIRDLEGVFTSATNVTLSYKLQQVVDDPNYVSATIYDGVITDRNDNHELSTDVVIDSPGSHGIDVMRLPRNSQPYNYIQYANGDSVYLDWERSTTDDLAAYLIMRNNSLVATVSNVVTEELSYALSGGRYSVSGVHDQRINRWIPVTFHEGYIEFEGTQYAFTSSGMSYTLPYGITLTLHDEPEVYENFEIFVGIQSWITLPNQPSGEWNYKVTAIDDAANTSVTLEKKVYVHPIPTAEPEFNPSTGEVSFWGNVDQVRIYSDTLPSGVVLDYIYEEAPVQTLIEDGLVDLPPGARFYARPVIDGIEHRTLNIHTMVDPEVIVGELGVATDLTGQPRPDGTFRLSWLYLIPDEDKATAFRVYSSLDGVNFGPEQVVPRSIVSNVFNEVLEYTTETLNGWATDTEVWFYVVAVDVAEEEGLPSNVISLIADATPPTLTGDLDGLNL